MSRTVPPTTTRPTPSSARPGRPLTCLGVWVVVAALALGAAACGSDEQTASPPGEHHPPTSAAAESGATETTEAPEPHQGDIEVVARDFAFDDLPPVVAAGAHTVTFANEGTEAHEMFLFANPDGLALEEIAALGPEGAPEAVDVQGLVIVGPGSSDSFEVDLAPGTYEVACFIPTPTDGRAHFEHGMHATIEVV